MDLCPPPLSCGAIPSHFMETSGTDLYVLIVMLPGGDFGRAQVPLNRVVDAGCRGWPFC